MEYQFEQLKALIDYIQSVYDEFTQEWLENTTKKVNLKKKCVCHIDTEHEIYQLIIEYVQFLNDRCMDVTLQVSSVCHLPVTMRVKTQNSIEYKIQNYKTAGHEGGKVPINKCMNDLFGIRVMLYNSLTYEQICAFMDKTYRGSYRCINSSKGEYKATHIYFKGNNHVFPWELQVWNECDRINNFDSHKKYKQGYTTWEKESKEGGIING